MATTPRRPLWTLILFVLLILLSIESAQAQYIDQYRLNVLSRIDQDTEFLEGITEDSCDSIWDGALFGIIPGIFIGEIYGVGQVGCGGMEPHGCARYFIGGAALGAAVGAFLDWRSCKEQDNSPAIDQWKASLLSNPDLLLIGVVGDSATVSGVEIRTRSDKAKLVVPDLVAGSGRGRCEP